jgi:N-acetylglucosaminyl-diphospho-decaprenol L-rhamnosyltransferase
MDSKKLTIVIVSFKSEAKIINCLNSISDPVNIIVVENSNNYNFKKNLEEKFTNLKCILTGSNLGYAVANNIGLNQVKTKYALILNPDTLLNDHVIKNFLNRAEKQKDFWLMGPGNDQMVELEFNNNSLIEVNNLKGFAIFLNLAKFNNTFFDENFFLYFEEIDLCKRVKNTNGKIYLDRNIKIIHQGASSVQDDKKFELEKNRNWHWMWSTFYYNKKHKGFFLALINILPKFFSASIKTLIYSLLFNKNKRDIYYCRLSGIVNSIIGNKSWYRPSLD